ncbi:MULTISPECIES: response regulator [unclassified Caballeronia]|uniref:response regulator n=1 Tax=unclassified Caballeronia TaxID=2646786 RepID=UPI00285CFA59|nr:MULTISPECIES: response regulator [unclassified Caballeronia]MDR5777609.1 response regulator [Caballeronia sp. LZ002]MDR5853047.1 response regulator [Caballeronia sp. LZ003]
MRQVRRSRGQWSTRTFDHRAVLTAVVVDDQELVADSVAAALDTAGLEAHPVYSGPAAVASCAMLRPQLVLLDISMPQQDGFVTAAILRRTQAARDVIIIAYTAFDETFVRARSEVGDFDGYFQKGQPIDALIALIHSFSSSPRVA